MKLCPNLRPVCLGLMIILAFGSVDRINNSITMLSFLIPEMSPRVCYLRIENAEGYVLIAVYLFIYLFVCVLLA